MIKQIQVTKNGFFKPNLLKFKDFNLVTGKNGTGKSFFCKTLKQQPLLQGDVPRTIQLTNDQGISVNELQILEYTNSHIHFFDEKRIRDLEFNNGMYDVTLERRSFAKQILKLFIERLENKEDDKELIIELFNKHFFKLFKRKLIIPTTMLNPFLWEFQKKNNDIVKPISDGLGIGNIFLILIYLVTAETKDCFIIEEPSLGLNPSQISPLLDCIEELQKELGFQCFFTSHDVLFRTEFFKRFDEGRFTITAFNEKDSLIELDQMTLKSKEKFLKEFLLEIDFKENTRWLKEKAHFTEDF